jgi:hypothetical protein
MRVTRHIRGFATATLTLAALGVTAGIATAGEQGTAELFPNPARPGDAVAVNTAFCEGDDSATGDATTLGAGTFLLEPGTHPEVLIGQFTVPIGTRAGDYAVNVRCAGGGLAVATLRVVEADSTSSPAVTSTSTTTSTATATASASPSGGVQGGIGGPGDNTPVVLAGTSAVLIAVAAGGVWVLRRRNSAGDHH